MLSGLFVICANGWMNAPAGFDWIDGKAVNIDPGAAMFNRAAWQQELHMTIAAFCATGFAVAGIHAIGLLRNPTSVFTPKLFRSRWPSAQRLPLFSRFKAIGWRNR